MTRESFVGNIRDYIAHLKAGGSYTPLRDAIRLLAVDPVAGSSAMNHERQTRAVMAMKHGRALEKKRRGNSLMPAEAIRTMDGLYLQLRSLKSNKRRMDARI